MSRLLRDGAGRSSGNADSEQAGYSPDWGLNIPILIKSSDSDSPALHSFPGPTVTEGSKPYRLASNGTHTSSSIEHHHRRR